MRSLPGRLYSWIVHLAFVLAGILTTFLGPLLPTLSLRWQLDDAQAGFLFTAQFCGSLAGVWMNSLLLQTGGFRLALASGYGLMGTGTLLLLFDGWMTGVAGLLVLGAGLGIIIPGSNLLISELYPNRREVALNQLNVTWGIGALGCPFLISFSLNITDLETFLVLLGLVQLLPAVLCAWFPFRVQPPAPLVPRLDSTGIRLWFSPVALLSGLILFLYVGSETAVGGWVPSYAVRLDSVPERFWPLAQSCFWGTLLVGRLLVSWFLRYSRARTWLVGGLCSSFLGLLLFLNSRTIFGMLPALAMVGLGFSTIYPTIVAWFSAYYGKFSRRISPLVFSMGSLGGAVLPWLVGKVASLRQNLSDGLVILLFAVALMILLSLILLKAIRAGAPADQQR